MSLTFKRILMIALLLVIAEQAYAQSSLGIGASDSTTSMGNNGWFGTISSFIYQYQQEFYRRLSLALSEMKDDPTKLWLPVAISFAYGVFHAAGPGHGKAVISSYMIANEVQLKRGITLSFISAFAQGVMALLVVGATYLLLRGISISQLEATFALELVSYGLIILFGLWILQKKLRSHFMRKEMEHHHNHSDHLHSDSHAHGCSHNHSHLDDHHHQDHAHHNHHHTPGEVCPDCGHAHIPAPETLNHDISSKQAWSAVIAVGIRPCSGAIFVLSFALINGLYLGGILSVFAMSIGTAITVSTLATLAVTAKNTAVKFTQGESSAYKIGSIIEIFGALLIIFFGALMLTAALS